MNLSYHIKYKHCLESSKLYISEEAGKVIKLSMWISPCESLTKLEKIFICLYINTGFVSEKDLWTQHVISECNNVMKM